MMNQQSNNGSAAPSMIEVVNTIKDMHSGSRGPAFVCPHCMTPHPCRTYAYVDGLLAERFEPEPPADTVL